MTVFVDTSALYASIAAGDAHHAEASATLTELLGRDALVTHNYVCVETISLVHARHGRRPLRRVRDLLDAIETFWVDADIHDAALGRLTGRGRAGPSFVDLVSFEVMRRLDLREVFAFDDDFAVEGFRARPG